MEPLSCDDGRWIVLGRSVLGASHERAGLPNQDALHPAAKTLVETGVLAVSDGHGSAKSFRSDRGAQFAVEVACDLGGQLLQELSHEPHPDLLMVENRAQEQLPKAIVDAWRAKVESDFNKEPFADEELRSLEAQSGVKARAAVEGNPWIAYGTTLLLIVFSRHWMAFIQIGDGDILFVDASGHVQKPVQPDERLLGNETTSLAGDKPWADFRVSTCPIDDQSPCLVLASTDGYANSFVDDAGFQQVATDIFAMISAGGLGGVEHGLESWLNEASRCGSGDDVTLGLIVRSNIIPVTAAEPPAVPILTPHAVAAVEVPALPAACPDAGDVVAERSPQEMPCSAPDAGANSDQQLTRDSS